MDTKISDPNELSPCLGEGDGVAVKMMNTKRRVILDVLMACWGLSPWLGVNGFFVQLPLLVDQLPEQWALPSAMTVAVQTANIGLLLYAALHRMFPRLSDSLCILALLLIAALAIFINAFTYSVTTVIGGSERSVAFLAMTFFSGLVGCTSSVLFYPYLRHYRDIYLTTYLVGEGLSGFIPSALSLVQGVGGEPMCVQSADNSTLVPLQPPPLFGPTIYMLVLGGLAVASMLSFLLIDSGGLFASERVSTVARNKDEEAVRPLSLMSARWAALLALATCLNVVAIGVLPHIQSYSCRPYGVRAYHLSTALSTMANPLACLAGVWLSPARPRALAAGLAVAFLPFCYILATALLRPAPPLLYHPSGEVLVVLCWVVVTAILSYARMWTLERGRRGGARGMRGCGVASQLGSAGGSLAMFLLISNTSIFVQAPVCPQTL
ncbi:solute carrier family 52, riboflavin transporter, member 3-like isoform X2 [Plodia interpunctella]|uniref:solute carrier family 52, riboflavin transporter, member 3-like isoform X2 n=1 Tax=Plodia interpunctella TaxID=58824 RepID=UPI002367C2E0|nr:solute carrier family 52, riboflavin transporter, member 3-like isoform X2 [Plodia interpunctella]